MEAVNGEIGPGSAALGRWKLFLNVGHFMDHLFMLLFPAVAALVLESEWQMSYAALIALATPGLFASGAGSMLAGWLGDRWSPHGMMVVFFGGSALACTLAGLAQGPLWMTLAVFCIGVFASIYHPVGLALLVREQRSMGASLAVNGICGNLGGWWWRRCWWAGWCKAAAGGWPSLRRRWSHWPCARPSGELAAWRDRPV